MGLFSSLFGKSRSEIEKVIIKHLEAGNEWMLQGGSSSNRKGSHFEATLISALFLLKFANAGAPREYPTIEKITFNYLFEIGGKIKYSIPMDLSDFINMRFEQNTKELENVIESKSKAIPVKASFNLYGTPLKPNSGEFLNPMAFMAFTQGFMEYLKFTEEVLPVISGAIRHV